MPVDVALRPADDRDRELLYRVYASTRERELATTGWTMAETEAFLRMQFAAQDRYWHDHYADTSWDVVLAGGVPAGRFYVARWRREIRIVDIALLPEWRNRGIATALIGGLFAEGDATGRPVTIHVETFNPARRLYERLGFVQTADRGVYLFLERPPGAPPPQTNTAS